MTSTLWRICETHCNHPNHRNHHKIPRSHLCLSRKRSVKQQSSFASTLFCCPDWNDMFGKSCAIVQLMLSDPPTRSYQLWEHSWWQLQNDFISLFFNSRYWSQNFIWVYSLSPHWTQNFIWVYSWPSLFLSYTEELCSWLFVGENWFQKRMSSGLLVFYPPALIFCLTHIHSFYSSFYSFPRGFVQKQV